MEDIEDLLIGTGAGTPPGFRSPLTSATVGFETKKNQRSSLLSSPSPSIPGTQTIFIKTFGCSHNQSDSEYMAGQLSAFGYSLSDNPDEADLWLINTYAVNLTLWYNAPDEAEVVVVMSLWGLQNDYGGGSCTVKSPSQSAMDTIITKGKSSNKPLVVAGCVPQGSRDTKELEGISIVGVQQIDRVVEVVEETLKGHEVRLLTRKTLPALDLPKVRKNKFVEILPINVGCLGACTYCKTKHARGHLGSYTIDSLVGRVKSVVSDGVKEIWLSSEDTGAYGRDIGVNLPTLLNALVAELPADASTMLRIGMTNPPFILEHLKEIAEVLRHPCVYTFLHVPVQSGSDAILTAMNREYTVSEFRTVVDTLTELVPGMQIATDIICGFPGETDEDFEQTVNLIREYKFSQVHISQFYPRPGTPAARMKKVPSNVVKRRSRELTNVFEAFTPYSGMEGKVERIWITDIASDGVHLPWSQGCCLGCGRLSHPTVRFVGTQVGHTKGYIQVLVIAPDNMLGSSALAKITSVGRWSVFGEIIETINHASDNKALNKQVPNQDMSSLCCNQTNTCVTSEVPESCACGNVDSCCSQSTLETADNSRDTVVLPQKQNSKNLFGWILRKRKNLHKRVESELASGSDIKQEKSMKKWDFVDKALLGGISISILTIIALLVYLRVSVIWS
ncbi:threonylcarbamoyladenosine tRNA methylthiotransferase-like protein [Trifolium pratense]|uniref:Threonylcarbamoyladenosine tRNA methylthiotransferase n=1 Tax=Trifolium pratense TaxID=57577 RepID=A0A2K3NSH0_TRIPR|nr:threonylcarbamoyladenosine tRNA methylthiotransferase-like protein [Trifolium pratense]